MHDIDNAEIVSIRSRSIRIVMQESIGKNCSFIASKVEGGII